MFVAAALKLLDWSKIEQLSEVGCFVEQIKEVGVYYFQAKANSYNPQHRELSLLVQPASQVLNVTKFIVLVLYGSSVRHMTLK